MKYKGGGTTQQVTKLKEKLISHCRILEIYINKIMILMFNKGDKEDFNNYRSLHLLHTARKFITKFLINRINKLAILSA